MPRYILTGTPGAGKTALLRALERRGYAVVEEAATDVIGLAHAEGTDDPWSGAGFVDEIVTLQRLRQERSPRSGTVFVDRSPVCTLALSRWVGRPPSALLAAEVRRIVAEHVYQRDVFFVRHQGFVVATAARRISFEQSLRFEQLHETTYRELGFELVEVPAGPLAARRDVILERVRQSAGASGQASL